MTGSMPLLDYQSPRESSVQQTVLDLVYYYDWVDASTQTISPRVNHPSSRQCQTWFITMTESMPLLDYQSPRESSVQQTVLDVIYYYDWVDASTQTISPRGNHSSSRQCQTWFITMTGSMPLLDYQSPRESSVQQTVLDVVYYYDWVDASTQTISPRVNHPSSRQCQTWFITMTGSMPLLRLLVPEGIIRPVDSVRRGLLL